MSAFRVQAGVPLRDSGSDLWVRLGVFSCESCHPDLCFVSVMGHLLLIVHLHGLNHLRTGTAYSLLYSVA